MLERQRNITTRDENSLNLGSKKDFSWTYEHEDSDPYQLLLRKGLAERHGFGYVGVFSENGLTIAYHPKKGWFHISTEGEPISSSYAMVGNFSEGLAAVYPKYGAENEAVYINESDNRVFSQTFESAGKFKHGIARVVKDNKVFWINKKGDNAFATGIEPVGQAKQTKQYLKRERVFYTAEDFSEDLVVVRDFPRDIGERIYEISRNAYMDRNGNNAFPGRVFRYAQGFRESVAWVSDYKDGKYPTLINKEGWELLKGMFYEPHPFHEEVAVVNAVYDPREPDYSITNQYYFINKKGEDITGRRFIGVNSFSEGLAAVNLAANKWDSKKWTYVDHDIDPVFPKRKFSSAQSFNEGLAVVGHLDNKPGSWKYYYINKNGEQAFDGIFDSAESFRYGVAHVNFGDKNFYIDYEGKKVF